MQRSHTSVIDTLLRAFTVSLMLLIIGCFVSRNERAQVQTVVDRFASEWNDEPETVWHNAAPPLRNEPLDVWLRDKRYIDTHWGRLESVKILELDRPAPTIDIFSVTTEMHYEKGTTTGSLGIDMRHGQPVLNGAVPTNWEQHPPK
jgi:hypothetical protein